MRSADRAAKRRVSPSITSITPNGHGSPGSYLTISFYSTVNKKTERKKGKENIPDPDAVFSFSSTGARWRAPNLVVGTHGPGASSRSLILSSSSPRRVSRVVLLSHYYVAVAAALGMRLTNTYRGVPSTCTTSAATFRFRGKLLCGSTSSSPLCRFVGFLLLFFYPRSLPPFRFCSAHRPWALDLTA